MTLPDSNQLAQERPWLLTVIIYVFAGGRLWAWLGTIIDNEPVRGAIFTGYTLVTFSVFVTLRLAAQ